MENKLKSKCFVEKNNEIFTSRVKNNKLAKHMAISA